LTRLAGHSLFREGAPYQGLAGAQEQVGRVSVAGPGRARCSCSVKSGRLATAAARRAWHREHKDAVRNLAARQDALGSPVRTVSIVVEENAPVAGYVVHFSGFGEDVEHIVSPRKYRGERIVDLTLQAIEVLLGLEAIQGLPFALKVLGGATRQRLAAALHLLPATWTVSSRPPSGEATARGRELLMHQAQDLPAEPDFFRRSFDSRGKRIVRVSADASSRMLDYKVDGVPMAESSTGWVIWDLKKRAAQIGHRRLPNAPARVDLAELHAIEHALRAVTDHPAARDTNIGRIVVTSDSASAIRLLYPGRGNEEPIVCSIRALTAAIPVPVEFEWIKGHDSNSGNVIANALARNALKNRASDEDKAKSLAAIEKNLQNAIEDAAIARRDLQINEMDQARARRVAEATEAASVPPAPITKAIEAAASLYLAARRSIPDPAA